MIRLNWVVSRKECWAIIGLLVLTFVQPGTSEVKAQSNTANCGCDSAKNIDSYLAGIDITALYTGQIIQAFPELKKQYGGLSALEQDSFLHSEQAKRYLKKRDDLIAELGSKEFKIVFDGSKLSDYDLKQQGFILQLDGKMNVFGPFTDMDFHTIEAYYFNDLPLYKTDAEAMIRWPDGRTMSQLNLIVRYPKENALAVERNKANFRVDICFKPEPQIVTGSVYGFSGMSQEKYVKANLYSVRIIDKKTGKSINECKGTAAGEETGSHQAASSGIGSGGKGEGDKSGGKDEGKYFKEYTFKEYTQDKSVQQGASLGFISSQPKALTASEANLLLKGACLGGNVKSIEKNFGCDEPANYPGTCYDGPVEFSSVTYGSFSAIGRKEAVLGYFGCESHATKYGGSVLLRQEEDSWKLIGYFPGTVTNDWGGKCYKVEWTGQADQLLCVYSESPQGIETSSIYLIKMVGGKFVEDTLLRTELLPIEDLCGKNKAIGSRFDKWELIQSEGRLTGIKLIGKMVSEVIPENFKGKKPEDFWANDDKLSAEFEKWLEAHLTPFEINYSFDGSFHLSPGDEEFKKKLDSIAAY